MEANGGWKGREAASAAKAEQDRDAPNENVSEILFLIDWQVKVKDTCLGRVHTLTGGYGFSVAPQGLEAYKLEMFEVCWVMGKEGKSVKAWLCLTTRRCKRDSNHL